MSLLPEGCGVALVTPFDNDGTQDLVKLRHMVEHVLNGGVDFIVVLGTTPLSLSASKMLLET